MVQVPRTTIYSMETVGDKPALRFEVNIAGAKTFYPNDVEPPKIPGITWLPARVTRNPGDYEASNVPHLRFSDIVEKAAGRNGQVRFIHDDRAVSNVIYGYEKNLGPINPADRGHYHAESAEFWLIMAGKIRYALEDLPLVIADEGDVVYVPRYRFHLARFHGPDLSTRLAINGYPTLNHVYDFEPAPRAAAPAK
jgi:hypothetical protein